MNRIPSISTLRTRQPQDVVPDQPQLFAEVIETITTPERQRLDLARRLANCGARPVLEALLAVQRGEPVDGVLAEFARLPSGCDRPRLPGAAQIVAMSGDGRGGTQ